MWWWGQNEFWRIRSNVPPYVTSVSSDVLHTNPLWDMLTKLLCGTSELEMWCVHTNFRDFWWRLTKQFPSQCWPSCCNFDNCQYHNAAIKNRASMSSALWWAEFKSMRILKIGPVLGKLCVPKKSIPTNFHREFPDQLLQIWQLSIP